MYIMIIIMHPSQNVIVVIAGNYMCQLEMTILLLMLFQFTLTSHKSCNLDFKLFLPTTHVVLPL